MFLQTTFPDDFQTFQIYFLEIITQFIHSPSYTLDLSLVICVNAVSSAILYIRLDTALLSIRLDTPPPFSLLSASHLHHGLSFEVPVPTSFPSLRPSFVSMFRPLPCGYTAWRPPLWCCWSCWTVSLCRPADRSVALQVGLPWSVTS